MAEILVLLIILAIIVIAVLAKFFVRATRNTSLVRTGLGGRQVIMDGGGFAIPWFQEVSRVNMQALKLEVRRAGESSLITRDHMRVDIGAEFFVSVIPSEEGVARAAQSLGERTFSAEKLSELIEGRLVDALRSVAATMTLDELHAQRSRFTDQVFAGLADWFGRNGLELESVSLTALDQTPFAGLDENNVFNAEGMRKLAEVVANARKERAGIDANAEVSVRLAAMEANKRKFEIDLAEQQAEIEKINRIETLKAAQLAEVSKRKADGELEAARARIEMERQIRAADIASEQALQEAEIEKEKTLQQARIATDQAVKTAAINQEREIELANQQRDITLAEHSQARSQAIAAADAARAEAVRAAEEVTSAREIAAAQRSKAVALLHALREAEIKATGVRMAAQSEKDAQIEKSKAALEKALAKSRAMEAKAEAVAKIMQSKAAGKAAMIAAENSIEPAAAVLKADLARLKTLPEIAAAMVKPMEKIDSIKIHQISGLNSPGAAGGDNKSPLTQAMESLLGIAVQLPAMKQIGKELGVEFDDESLKEISRTINRNPGKSKPDS